MEPVRVLLEPGDDLRLLPRGLLSRAHTHVELAAPLQTTAGQQRLHAPAAREHQITELCSHRHTGIDTHVHKLGTDLVEAVSFKQLLRSELGMD